MFSNPATTEDAAPIESQTPDLSKISLTRFDELTKYNLVDPNIIETITQDLGYANMTPVQSATIKQALAGTDM